MNYEDWLATVPKEFSGDHLWKMEAYRLGLFVADVGWFDVTKLMKDKRTLALSDQLYLALGSISTNLAEAYSHGTGKDRARFYEYALGSARESRDGYYKSRHVLGADITLHRLGLLTQIIRLLLTMIPEQRGRALREDGPEYATLPPEASLDGNELEALLQNIPMP